MYDQLIPSTSLQEFLEWPAMFQNMRLSLTNFFSRTGGLRVVGHRHGNVLESLAKSSD